MFTRLSNEVWNLKVGLEKAKAPNAVRQIFTFFKEHPKELGSPFFEDSLSTISRNASQAYCEDPSLFDLALDLYIVLVTNYLHNQAKQLISFFDGTNNRLRAFRKVFAEMRKSKDFLLILASLTNTECSEYVVQQYEENNFTNEDIWGFQNLLSWRNPDYFLPFNKVINEKTNGKFALAPPRDMGKEREQLMQKDMNLLLSKEAFLEELRLIFGTLAKQNLTNKELVSISTENWANPRFSFLAVRVLRDTSRDRDISLETAIRTVNDWNWNWFCVSQSYEYLQKKMKLSNEHIDIIREWCFSNLDKVDFKTALVNVSNNQYTSSRLAIYLWYFLRKLHLDYPENVLLDLLSFDWVEDNQMLGIQYLEERLEDGDIVERVLENLGAGIVNNDVLKNHISYCRRNKIREVLPFALQEITNLARDSHVRQLALETYCEMTDALSELEERLPMMQDDFKWNVIEQLASSNSEYVRGFLLRILAEQTEEDRLKASEYLVGFQDVNGLKYYTDWVKMHKKTPGSARFSPSSLLSLRTLEAIPFLLELLKTSYEDDFVQDDFPRFGNVVLKALRGIALQSDKNYSETRDAVQTFIERNSSTITELSFLHIFLEELERNFYESRSAKADIDDVVQKLNEMDKAS